MSKGIVNTYHPIITAVGWPVPRYGAGKPQALGLMYSSVSLGIRHSIYFLAVMVRFSFATKSLFSKSL